MKRSKLPTVSSFFFLVLLCACSPPRPASPPTTTHPAPPPAPPIELFFDYPAITDPSFFPDRGIVLFTATDRSGTNVWRVDLEGKSGRITDCGADACRAVAALAGGRTLFSRSGDGRPGRIFVLDPGQQPVELPGQDGTAGRFIDRIADGRRFYTGGNGRDAHVFDLYEWNSAELKPRLVYKNDLNKPFFIGPVSPDGQLVALVRSRGEGGDELKIRDLAAGRENAVPVRDGDLIEPLFFLDRTLYYLADDGADRRGIMRYRPGDRQPERFLSDPAADYRLATVSTEGKRTRILTIKSRDGEDELLVHDPAGNLIPLAEPITGQIPWADFSSDGNTLVYLRGTETSPASLYLQGMWTGSRQLHGTDLKLDPELLVAGSEQKIPARDGLSLPAVLYQPRPDSRRAWRRPAVIWLHGGPGGEHRREYAPHLQYLVSRGYVALALNYRGSAGYGRKFLDADNRRHGYEDVDDVIDAAEWLAGKDFVDPKKIAVVGRSYGGFLALATMASLARSPETFAAGVDLFGPSNWVSALTELPPEARVFLPALYAEMGDPVKDREALLAISPVSFADRIRGPLLIIQGAGDSRVTSADTTELVRRIRERLGHVEYVFFADEGHGFGRVWNEISCWRRVAVFLDFHLLGSVPPVPPGDAVIEP